MILTKPGRSTVNLKDRSAEFQDLNCFTAPLDKDTCGDQKRLDEMTSSPDGMKKMILQELEAQKADGGMWLSQDNLKEILEQLQQLQQLEKTNNRLQHQLYQSKKEQMLDRLQAIRVSKQQLSSSSAQPPRANCTEEAAVSPKEFVSAMTIQVDVSYDPRTLILHHIHGFEISTPKSSAAKVKVEWSVEGEMTSPGPTSVQKWIAKIFLPMLYDTVLKYNKDKDDVNSPFLGPHYSHYENLMKVCALFDDKQLGDFITLDRNGFKGCLDDFTLEWASDKQ